MLRRHANALVSQENVAKSKGYFPKGLTNEGKLWSSFKRAAEQGDRIKIVGEFVDGKLPRDADGYVDWWKEDKLEKQISFFEDNKVGIVYSNCFIFFEKNKKTKIFSKKILRSGYITKDLFKDYKVSIMTVLLRRVAYDSASGFNSKYNIIGDFDLIIRLSNNWKFVSIQEPLAYYRIHSDNFSLKNEIVELEEFESLVKDSKIISDKNLKPHLHYINQRIVFLKTIKYINDGKFIKAIKNIIYFPVNFNKIKLIMYIFLPKKFIKKMQGL